MKLALLPGHTENKKGAYSPLLNCHEYDFWVESAMNIYTEARHKGLECCVFKLDGMSMAHRNNLVDAYLGGQGVAIELHFNALALPNSKLGDPRANGYETLYVEGKKQFAQIVHRLGLEALTEDNPLYTEYRKDINAKRGPRDRGLKLIEPKQAGWPSQSTLKSPSCLVEPFFSANKKEIDNFMRNKARYERALARSVIEWFSQKKLNEV